MIRALNVWRNSPHPHPASLQRELSPKTNPVGERLVIAPGSGRAGGHWVMNKASRWAGTVSVFLELPARRVTRIREDAERRRAAWPRSLSPEEE